MTLHKRKVKGKSFLETLSMKWRYSMVLLYKSDSLRKLSNGVRSSLHGHFPLTHPHFGTHSMLILLQKSA